MFSIEMLPRKVAAKCFVSKFCSFDPLVEIEVFPEKCNESTLLVVWNILNFTEVTNENRNVFVSVSI